MDSWHEYGVVSLYNKTNIFNDGLTNNNAINKKFQITSLNFDKYQNLIWCGDSEGFTRSFTNLIHSELNTGLEICLFTKFQTSLHNKSITLQCNNKEGILSLLNDNILFNNRRGVTLLNYDIDSFKIKKDQHMFKNLKTMAINNRLENEVFVGSSSSLFKIDLNKPNDFFFLNEQKSLTHIKSDSNFVIVGKCDGFLDIFDSRTNQKLSTLNLHHKILSDLDFQENYIATVGYTNRSKYSNLCYDSNNNFSFKSNFKVLADPLVTIHDIRMMKSIAPISFPFGASLVRFHPKFHNVIIISSRSGQLQFNNIFDEKNSHLYQVEFYPLIDQALTAPKKNFFSSQDNPCLLNLEVSDNGEFIAFSTSNDNLHLWSLQHSKGFVNFPSTLEIPNLSIPENIIQKVSIDETIPLSFIRMPYCKDFLLSNFSSDLVFKKEFAKLKINDFFSNFEHGKLFSYNKNAFHYLINPKHNTSKINFPKLISERGNFSDFHNKNEFIRKISKKKNNLISSSDDKFNVKNSEDDLKNEDNKIFSDIHSIFQYKFQNFNCDFNKNQNIIPNCYSILQVNYSKFGLKDFDFDYFNKTNNMYCGLENKIENSYINSLLQLYRYSSLFYNLIIKNLCSDWLPNDPIFLKSNGSRGSSILNELGYLFDMMQKSEGKCVNIHNFSEMLSQNKFALKQNLINTNNCANLNAFDHRMLLIDFNHFFLKQLNYNYLNQNKSLLFFNIFKLGFECSNFKKNKFLENQISDRVFFSFDLNLKSITNNEEEILTNQKKINFKKKNDDFSLTSFLEFEINNFILKYEHEYNTLDSDIEGNISFEFPLILSLNILDTNNNYMISNEFKNWLDPFFFIVENQNQSNKHKFSFFKSISNVENQNGYQKYELLGFVCQIVHESEFSKGKNNFVSFIKIENKWYLFNDFLVMPISEIEVFDLTKHWKRPVVILYEETTNSHHCNYFEVLRNNNIKTVNSEILYRDHFANTQRKLYKKEYEILTFEEAPTAGSIVAIDSEFVLLRSQKLEVYRDGYKNLICPKKLSLARISILRGDGKKKYVPFVDDYIIHTCEILDYLTLYSGIEHGDLNLDSSQKTLVTFQTAYRKLWLLLNLGVIFVGHDLYNDFRLINIQVPESQYKDTADIYYNCEYKRHFSLKFLAYMILKKKVQTNNHDSIEDAYTALKLFDEYRNLKLKGEFEKTLNNLYTNGKLINFRVPI